MNKIIYPNITLGCNMQRPELIEPEECHTGILTLRHDGDFCFQETIRRGRAPRNPKLFDGKLISMVRMQNGKYRIHMKNLPNRIDPATLPFEIYTEVIVALQHLE